MTDMPVDPVVQCDGGQFHRWSAGCFPHCWAAVSETAVSLMQALLALSVHTVMERLSVVHLCCRTEDNQKEGKRAPLQSLHPLLCKKYQQGKPKANFNNNNNNSNDADDNNNNNNKNKEKKVAKNKLNKTNKGKPIFVSSASSFPLSSFREL